MPLRPTLLEHRHCGGSVVSRNQVESTNIELWGLYNVLRSSCLNIYYYGARSVTWSRWNLWLQVGASLGSLGAVSGFIAAGTELAGAHQIYWKLGASFVGVISAICAALPAIMGHAEKINRFERLHFAYCELFQLAQRTIMDIRRESVVTQEQVGGAKMLADLYSRLGQLDDPDYKIRLKDQCEKKVREKYPPDSLWYATENGNQTAESPALQG
jgi:hypothetical protein